MAIKDSELWFKLAYQYFQEEQQELAIDAYKKGLLIRSDNPIHWHNLGFLYIEIEDYDNAIITLRTALILNPNLSIAWTELSSVSYTHLTLPTILLV